MVIEHSLLFCEFLQYKAAQILREVLKSQLFRPGDLEGENCLLVPPVAIVCMVLRFMNIKKCTGTLVTALWLSSPFWLLLTSAFGEFAMEHVVRYGQEDSTSGRNPNSLFGSNGFLGYVLAFRLLFS